MDSAALMEAVKSVSSDLWGVWFLLGAALVFWMQAGFAMVETGFTRAKNTGNIIMKNLMDFCIGTVVFILIGFGLFLGENAFFGASTQSLNTKLTRACKKVKHTSAFYFKIYGTEYGLFNLFRGWTDVIALQSLKTHTASRSCNNSH